MTSTTQPFPPILLTPELLHDLFFAFRTAHCRIADQQLKNLSEMNWFMVHQELVSALSRDILCPTAEPPSPKHATTYARAKSLAQFMTWMEANLID